MDPRELAAHVQWAKDQGWLDAPGVERARAAAQEGRDPLEALLAQLGPAQAAALRERVAQSSGRLALESAATLRTPTGHLERGQPAALFQSASGAAPGGSGRIAAPDDPDRFPGYRVIRELARGGMGAVLLAESLDLGRRVAIKVLLDTEHASFEDRERFAQEARAAAKLQHPQIVRIHHVGESGGERYIVMDFVEGESYEARLQQGPLPLREAADVAASVAETISFAHGRGVLHRDLKPANVIMSRDGPVIMDFGLAKEIHAADSGLTVAGEIMGTPSYMPPEQAGETERVDVRADVYSLGATLYCLLTGEPPFRGSTVLETISKLVSEPPRPPSALRPEVDKDLETICLQCLEKEPSDRYQSSAELAADLRRYLADEPIVARRPTLLERGARFARRHRALVRVAIPLLLALLAAGALGGRSLWSARQAAKTRADEVARAKAELEALEQKREAERARQAEEQRARRAELEAELARLAAAGALDEASLEAAVSKLVRLTDPEAQPLLRARLAEQTALLRAASREFLLDVLERLRKVARKPRPADEPEVLKRALDKVAAGEPLDRREGQLLIGTRGALRQARGAMLLAGHDDLRSLPRLRLVQDTKLQAPALTVAVARALGRLPSAPESIAALLAHLRVEENSARAASSARALLALGGVEGFVWVCRARRRFGPLSELGRPLDAELSAALVAQPSLLRELAAGAVAARADDLFYVSETLRELGRAPEARVLIQRAQALEPERRSWVLRLYFLELELGKRGEVRAFLEEELKRTRPMPEVCDLRAALALAEGRGFEEALEALDRILEAEPRAGWVWQRRGDLHRALRRYEKAHSDYSRAIALDPTRTDALLSRAEVLLELSQWSEAVHDVSVALEQEQGDARLWRVKGEAHLRGRQPKLALGAFQRALALSAKDVEARAGVVRAYGAMKSWLQASVEMNTIRATTKVHDAETASVYLRALWEGGDRGRAEAYARQLRETGVAALLVAAAEFERYRGGWAQAEADARLALEVKPGYVPARRSLTQSFLDQRRAEDAWQAFRPLLESQELLSPEVLLLGSRLTRAKGSHSAATKLAERALGIDPGLGEAWAELGRTHAARGAHPLAILYFSNGIVRAPDDAAIRRDLGLSQRALGRRDLALESFAAALAIDPRDPGSLYERGLTLLGLGEDPPSPKTPKTVRSAAGLLANALRRDPEHPRAPLAKQYLARAKAYLARLGKKSSKD